MPAARAGGTHGVTRGAKGWPEAGLGAGRLRVPLGAPQEVLEVLEPCWVRWHWGAGGTVGQQRKGWAPLGRAWERITESSGLEKASRIIPLPPLSPTEPCSQAPRPAFP